MFRIPAGTELSVARVDDPYRRWQRHVTKKDLYFGKSEGGRSGAVVFRYEDWLILTRWSKVKK